jgi:predicted RNase H-like HicB family nuclease
MITLHERNMTNTYTAIIKQDGKFWIGWIEEVPGVNCQAESRDELLETLQVTLGEAIQLNREAALREAHGGYQEEKVTV